MKNLYIVFSITIVLIISLIVFAFLFFEKEKHQSHIYLVEERGQKIGYIKADYYKTENKIIYKSTRFFPKELDYTTQTERILFSKEGFELEKFLKENINFGATTDSVFIKNIEKVFGFLAVAESKLSTISDITHAKDISVFNGESVATYAPFVDKYDFSIGGAQSFNVVYCPPGNLFAPARGKIIFRSIRDEYINVGGKKIKTEHLRVTAKGITERGIWVSKKDRSIVRLEIKGKDLLIKKVMSLPKILIKTPTRESGDYELSDALFPSGDIALAGTLTVPQKKEIMPAVLLVAGVGPYNRENAGLYTDMSAWLARNGYITLRFDNRGIGDSQGSNRSVGIDNEVKDVKSGLRFLMNHEKVDKDKLFIIAHGEICSFLPQIDFTELPVKGLVMLGITKPMPLFDFESIDTLDKINEMTKIEMVYPETLASLKKDTLEAVKGAKKEYITLQGRRPFVKRASQLLSLKPLEDFKKLDTPLLIICGKKDRFASPAYIEGVEGALKVAGCEFRVVYFRGLGHFFGEILDEENQKKHYKANEEMLGTVSDWLDHRSEDDLVPTPPSTQNPE
ncbi:MAG: dienelactone hydrolase family protein [Candidatus Omnitrophica bacterium]|nr:dienelactone hydrolase family protein [Candidatus Omnitrophota bacterium]